VVYLLCGVPGSGKTWVAQQLNNFVWVPHDKYKVDEYHEKILDEAQKTDKPILAEAPFRISVLVDQLREAGQEVKTYYITAPQQIIRQRYESRMKKPFPKQHQTNLKRYDERKWDFAGTSGEILDKLRQIDG
jgi:gluconate kinase